jgi:hypothetical protein
LERPIPLSTPVADQVFAELEGMTAKYTPQAYVASLLL